MQTNQPIKKSFIAVSKQHDFPIQNLPYGAFYDKHNTQTRIGVAIGDWVLDLSVLEQQALLPISSNQPVFNKPVLNDFLALGPSVWKLVRERITDLLSHDNPTIRDNEALRRTCFIPMGEVRLELPVHIGDYTDFYASEAHAKNIGGFFRDKTNPLLPNWKHMPIAYHGRSSSIVLSGTPIQRPYGQIKQSPDTPPVFAATNKLDFELEMGFFIGQGNPLGQPISITNASEQVFGFVMVNDWSARDIQQWEYQPLGPFLAKNFATSISPWVVAAEAMAPFKIQMPNPSQIPLPYLQQPNRQTYAIELNVAIKPAGESDFTTLSRSNYRYLYWSVEQQIAHHTITGCPLRPGDLLASGTISGPAPTTWGSLIELTHNGTVPIQLPHGQSRLYLQDGDEIKLTAWCEGGDYRLGFGEVTGLIV